MLHSISVAADEAGLEVSDGVAMPQGFARNDAECALAAGLDFAGLVAKRREQGLRAMLPLCPRPEQPALASGSDGEPSIYPRFQQHGVEPLPQRETLHVLSCASLSRLTTLCHSLLRRQLPDICFIVDGAALAALKGQCSARAEPLWHLVFSLSVPSLMSEEEQAWMQAEVAGYCREAGLERQLYDFVPQHETLHQRLLNPAENRQWWKRAGMTATRELFFETTLDRCETFLPALRQQRRMYGWRGRPLVYIQPQLGGRLCHMEFVFPHDTAEHWLVNAMVRGLAGELKRQGACFSRPCAGAKAGQSLLTSLGDGFAGMFAPQVMVQASRWPTLGSVQAA